jgi:hypothetical protein
LTDSEIDTVVLPHEIAGIEIYNGAGGSAAPPDLQREMNGCGSILIWTK